MVKNPLSYSDKHAGWRGRSFITSSSLTNRNSRVSVSVNALVIVSRGCVSGSTQDDSTRLTWWSNKVTRNEKPLRREGGRSTFIIISCSRFWKVIQVVGVQQNPSGESSKLLVSVLYDGKRWIERHFSFACCVNDRDRRKRIVYWLWYRRVLVVMMWTGDGYFLLLLCLWIFFFDWYYIIYDEASEKAAVEEAKLCVKLKQHFLCTYLKTYGENNCLPTFARCCAVHWHPNDKIINVVDFECSPVNVQRASKRIRLLAVVPSSFPY